MKIIKKILLWLATIIVLSGCGVWSSTSYTEPYYYQRYNNYPYYYYHYYDAYPYHYYYPRTPYYYYNYKSNPHPNVSSPPTRRR